MPSQVRTEGVESRLDRSNSLELTGLGLMEPLEQRLLLSAAPVIHHDFEFFHAAQTARPATSTAPVGLTPAQIRAAYGVDELLLSGISGDGAGQTVAIVDAYDAPTIAADLATFNAIFGLPDANLIVLGQDGSTNLPGTDPAGQGDSWAVETSLDVEWIHAMAPAATIVLVEANSASYADMFAAVDTARNYAGVSVVSLSWGSNEFSGETAYDSYLTTPAGHTGVTFVASTGDSGAYANSRSKGVLYPAASANVVAVGGTTLALDASDDWSSETGWGYGTRSYRLGGSGGGISRYVSQPAWQGGVVSQSSTRRTVPDVAADADPYSGVAVIDSWDFPSAPWVQVGGTSLSAPLWGGIIALANQARALAGNAALDGASETLPLLYNLPASDFHDITSGNNGYAASAGYDLVTGRGSPIVNLLVADMAGGPITPQPVIASFTADPASTPAGPDVTLDAYVVDTDPAQSISSVSIYLESDGLAGLDTASDTYLGEAIQDGSDWTYAFPTDSLTPGGYTLYALAADTAALTDTASVSVTIRPPAPTNDNFADAETLSGTAATAVGTNVDATKETGEPAHARDAGGASVWYDWTADASGKVTLTTAGSNFDTLLAVYTGDSVAALRQVAANDDVSRYDLTSALTFKAIAGTTYRIAVDGYRGATGNIDLALTEVLAPSNDNFASAAVLASDAAGWTGSNVGATSELGEPFHARLPGGSSVWLSWTPTTTQAVTLSTAGSTFDTVLAVYTGDSVAALRQVAANDDASRRTLTSAVTFTAVAGTTYHIAIDGYRAASGDITLSLSAATVSTLPPPGRWHW